MQGQIWAALWVYLNLSYLGYQQIARDSCSGIWANYSKQKKASDELANIFVCGQSPLRKKKENLQFLPVCLLLKITP